MQNIFSSLLFLFDCRSVTSHRMASPTQTICRQKDGFLGSYNHRDEASSCLEWKYLVCDEKTQQKQNWPLFVSGFSKPWEGEIIFVIVVDSLKNSFSFFHLSEVGNCNPQFKGFISSIQIWHNVLKGFWFIIGGICLVNLSINRFMSNSVCVLTVNSCCVCDFFKIKYALKEILFVA